MNIREIVGVIRASESVSSFELAVYAGDTSNPIFMPFVAGNPENSIVYKIQPNHLKPR